MSYCSEAANRSKCEARGKAKVTAAGRSQKKPGLTVGPPFSQRSGESSRLTAESLLMQKYDGLVKKWLIGHEANC
ncbi:hypothetical protein CEXT_410871 [Caerostris extrusa]|uniref:Uncharacterized protein n=1 Tax=Caerostris extrusa TaxID=172846 RepID=A0AAV4V8G5_CAEEX|nr:hypothetical protein CEXT_410871 [Caerostris extrusa]